MVQHTNAIPVWLGRRMPDGEDGQSNKGHVDKVLKLIVHKHTYIRMRAISLWLNEEHQIEKTHKAATAMFIQVPPLIFLLLYSEPQNAL